MRLTDDLYVQTQQESLLGRDGGATPPAYGLAIMCYEVRQLMDVRTVAGEPTSQPPRLNRPSYLVTCTLRLIFPNQNPFSFVITAPSRDNVLSAGYAEYPLLITSTMTPQAVADQNLRLVKYSPRTLNASVGTSRSEADTASSGITRQHTSGSSMSSTNSYGVSVSAGLLSPPSGTSMNSNSNTNTSFKSDSTGGSSGQSQDVSSGDMMSIKDWAAYAQLSTPTQPSGAAPFIPTWIWGQEYPWDAVQFRPQSDSDINAGTPLNVSLPSSMSGLLFGTDSNKNTVIYPPSHLSLFGVDVSMKATWLVDLPANLDEQSLVINNVVEYAQGFHGLDSATPPAQTIQQLPIPLADISPTTLDLTLLGLDPVWGGGRSNGAVIGFFLKEKFVVSPDNDPAKKGQFKILSDANTLQAQGSGFDASPANTFVTTFVTTPGQALVSLDFKIADTVVQYCLFLKHWNTTAVGCTLEITINGMKIVTRHVDTQEGEGGDNNLMTIQLRNLNYASINYHDYLQLGHNHIDIVITPDKPNTDAGYVLRVAAIGEE